jgi:putative transcriptional regulator
LIDTGLISSSDIRFYAGYSGWQPKQLEQEMEDNSWIIMQPEMSYVFENKPNQLWKKLVKTLGSDFAPWINYPNDPNMN